MKTLDQHNKSYWYYDPVNMTLFIDSTLNDSVRDSRCIRICKKDDPKAEEKKSKYKTGLNKDTKLEL